MSKRVGGPGASVRRRRSGCGVAIGLPQRRIRPLTAGGGAGPQLPERRRRSHRGKVKRDPGRSSAAPVDRLRAPGPPATIRADGQLSGAVGPALPHPRHRSRAAATSGVESTSARPATSAAMTPTCTRRPAPRTGEGPVLVDEPCTGVGCSRTIRAIAATRVRGHTGHGSAGRPARGSERA